MTSNSWSLFWIQQRRNMQKKLKFTSLRLWFMTSTLHRLHQLMVLHGFAAEKEFVKQFSMFSSQYENWEESNMADRSPMTDTSTDVDPDDQNRMFDRDQYGAIVLVSDSNDGSKEKSLDQKTLRRLAQNREAARKSRLRKKLNLHGEKSGHKGLLSIATEEGKSRHAAKPDNKCKRRVIAYSWSCQRWP